MTADDLALIATNVDGGGGTTNLQPFTLRTVLSQISKFGGYAGMNIDSLADEALDNEISIRFQTTFLPVEESKEGAFSRLEFSPEAYNYSTLSDDDPRNLVLLCTTQGLAIQQDGEGAKKLYHHVKTNNVVKRYWLEAESTKHKVGGSQKESKEEKMDAIKRGKATSSVIGIRSMGTRFNVLMTIQVPLKQVEKEQSSDIFYSYPKCCMKMALNDFDSEILYDSQSGSSCSSDFTPTLKSRSRLKKKAISSAARVSRGSFVDEWNGLTVKSPKRHPSEHITATIVMYYTCEGATPTEMEVKSAIDDLEELYKSVQVNGTLSDEKFDFMKSELSVKNMIDIKKKVITQPPPKPDIPLNADVFPLSTY